MAESDRPSYHGEIITATVRLGVGDVCATCGIRHERLIELVHSGIVTPSGAAPETWTFSEVEVLRMQKALRLHRDLGIDLVGLGLVLDLLDELAHLRRALARHSHEG